MNFLLWFLLVEDFWFVEGGLVFNKFDLDMFNLSGLGGGDVIVVDSLVDSLLILDIKFDLLLFWEVLCGDKGLLVFRFKVFDFFLRVEFRIGIVLLLGLFNVGFSCLFEGGFCFVEFLLLVNK